MLVFRYYLRRSFAKHAALRKLAVLVGPAVLLGCQTYQPRPLPETVSLAADVGALVEALPPQQAVSLSDGVSMNEAAVIAVFTNPDLIARRKRLDVARAQLYSARLLPDPQVGFGVDIPSNNDPSLVNALTTTVNYDLLALLTRSSTIDAQSAAADQARLEILWQEWLVAQQARLLVVREKSEALKLELLAAAMTNFSTRQALSSRALADGNLTIESAGPDLTALLDVGSRWYQLQDQHAQTDHELRALLGLQPGAPLEFSALPAAPVVAAGDPAELMTQLGKTRPDLLALQYGYASQEARVRKTVLSAFPALGIGFTGARDTGNIRTLGFGVSLNLPVFSGNRGELRVERATREQLRAEYRARLAQDYSDISKLVAEQGILEQRRGFLRARLPGLDSMVEQARKAYASRDLDALVFLNLEMSLITKRMELIDVEQSLWEITIALDTLTARPAQ